MIATSVGAALAADYPELELLVLDDGSPDRTAEIARATAADDPRCTVLRDPMNRGKAERLNDGFARARHELVLVLEAAPIIGLIRRTQSLTGRVGVAGVLGLFRRDRVLAVGGYDSRMATEDIDLTGKLLLAGWETAYEPHALVGMEVPASLRARWAQRKRWARGQGEGLRSFLLGPLYPAAYWTISAAAALRCQAIALVRGPREQRVVSDIEREAVDAEAVAPPR